MSSTRQDRTKPHDGRRPKRTFTVAEANRSLVLVKRIVVDVVFEYSRLLELQEAFEAAEAGGTDEQCEEVRLALIRSAGKLRTYLEELDDVGVELKDWSLGVVDFPCIAGGRKVCLCWQHGHDTVQSWHEVNAGFLGRRPIETLPVSGTYVAGARDARPAHPPGTAGLRRGAPTDLSGR